jgi:hypothetical protein
MPCARMCNGLVVAEEARSHRVEDGDGGDWLGDVCAAKQHLDVLSPNWALHLGWDHTSGGVADTYTVPHRQAVVAR